MSRYRTIIGLSLALLVGHSTTWAADLTPRRLLAGQYLRTAIALQETRSVDIRALQDAVFLLQQATDLDPDNVEIWRILLELIDSQDRPEDDGLRQTVLEHIAQLDPNDDVVQLRLINTSIAQYQTLQERIEAYEQLLSPQKRAELGDVITSRLALDLALLLSRNNDVQGYSKWVGEAVAVDPSNRAAVAEAAGFFRMNVEDAFAEAELLTSLMLADPTEVITQVSLAQLLLDHGAYAAADRIYRLTEDTFEASASLAPNGMLADRAVAQWGRGDAEAALLTIRRRQNQADLIFRQRVRQQKPELSRLELARIKAPVAATLATIRAAIHNRLGDDQVESSLLAVQLAYQSEIGQLRGAENPDTNAVLDLYLQTAWVLVWLDGDMDLVATLLDNAKVILGQESLSPSVQSRFDGWIALRRGEPDQAIALLETNAEDDLAAQLGLAVAHLRKGNLHDGAAGLLRVARAQPGTLIGVWATDLLAEVIGRRLKPAELNPQAEQFIELIGSIPLIYDRFAREPGLAVELRIVPAKDTFKPYEPIIINLEITNRAPFPLAIDNGGPIRSRIVLVPSIQIARDLRISRLDPIVVDIDRRLRLEPRQTLVVPIDLRRTRINDLLNNLHPMRGALLKIRAVSNFWVPTEGVVRSGVLGSDIELRQPVRVDGVRLTQPWLEYAMAAAIAPASTDDLVTMVLLSRLALVLQPEQATPEVIQLVRDSVEALVEGFAKIDSISQAWLLTALPSIGLLEPIMAMARKSPDKYVQISYLLYQVSGPSDPMLDAAKRSDDPDLQYVADLVEAAINRAQAASGQ